MILAQTPPIVKRLRDEIISNTKPTEKNMIIQREKKDKIRLGYIGLGRRGYDMLNKCFGEMADVEISWICDLNEQKIEKTKALLKEKGRAEPKATTNYREILADGSVDAVAIMTGWDAHVEIALASMNAGKYTALEVGCAYDLSECFALVDTYERTGSPLMLLENCCYGRREMMALKMVKEGIFGEIVHCDGGYLHYLPSEDLVKVVDGVEATDHYRVYEYAARNCEQYPTHELGPISKVLNINRGNRMMSLSSFASKSRALGCYFKENVSENHPLQGKTFAQGDIITTVITCAGGETIRLTLDTTLPRPYYSRNFTVRGTKGGCVEEARDCTFFFDGIPHNTTHNEKELYEKYDHPLHEEYSKIEALGSHGGMDWLVVRAFIESVKDGVNTPIDAYDSVAWMAIGPLSEASIVKGGTPVEFPDFTRGKWLRREPAVTTKYSLDEIIKNDTPIVPKK